jgi:hypothetical protein
MKICNFSKTGFMEATAALDKKINAYLSQLNTKQKKALITVAETFITEQEKESAWTNKAFIAEMDKRFAEYESGKVKGITLDELETGARAYYKKKKAKK